MNFLRVSRDKARRAERHYKLPKSTPADELKLKNLKQAGEKFMDAFSRRSTRSTFEE
jgi:hypothetical protein